MIKNKLSVKDYKTLIRDYLRKNMHYTNKEIENSLKEYKELLPTFLEKNYKVSTVAGIIDNNF